MEGAVKNPGREKTKDGGRDGAGRMVRPKG